MRGVIIFFFSILFCPASYTQDSKILGELEMGQYDIGFTTFYEYDRSRPFIREQIKLPSDQKIGRPIQINVWYPAKEGKEFLTILDYFKLTTKEIDFKADISSVSEVVKAVKREQINSHGIEINEEGLVKFLKEKKVMKAGLNATPSNGKFPIIIIGPETAFKWCFLAEFLASHGYVVVMTPKTGSSEKLPDFERTLFEKEAFIRAVQASHSDLQFVTSFIKELPYTDGSKLGLFGYSSNISDGLGLITRGVNFDAIVSLEGSIGGYTGGEVLSMSPFYSPYAITQPLLHIFSPSFGFNDYWISQYKYCERTLIATYDIRHDHFTTYGVLEEFVSDISGQAKKPPKLALKTAYTYSLNFFDSHLKSSTDAQRFVQQGLKENGIQSDFQHGLEDKWLGIKRLPALKTYDEYELQVIQLEGGFESVEEIYQELVKDNPQPFSKSTFFNFGRFLSSIEEKEKWYTYYTEAYKDFSEPYFLLAQEKQKLNKKDEAIRNYQVALDLFNKTDHVILEDIFTRIINRRLENLKN
jgi:tetratricopeptide (TPR) repeat protein